MGLMGNKIEILSILGDFIKETGSRMVELEKAVQGYEAAVVDKFDRIESRIDDRNGDVEFSVVMDIMRKMSGVMESFGKATLELNNKINVMNSRLDLAEKDNGVSALRHEIVLLREELKMAAGTGIFAHNGRATVDGGQAGDNNVGGMDVSLGVAVDGYEKIKKDMMECVDEKIDNALFEIHSANMNLYSEMMKLSDADGLRFKYVASSLSAMTHLASVGEKDLCKRGVEHLCAMLSSQDRMVKVDSVELDMLKRLAGRIEECDESLWPDLTEILSWFTE